MMNQNILKEWDGSLYSLSSDGLKIIQCGFYRHDKVLDLLLGNRESLDTLASDLATRELQIYQVTVK